MTAPWKSPHTFLWVRQGLTTLLTPDTIATGDDLANSILTLDRFGSCLVGDLSPEHDHADRHAASRAQKR